MGPYMESFQTSFLNGLQAQVCMFDLMHAGVGPGCSRF